ncbi:MAG: arginase family protein [Gammaproteobacteria bacterium]|nr:arginase family protein [Gammaproteobacteria bacterium]
MPKLSPETLARYREMDRPAFQFEDDTVNEFFARSTAAGVRFDNAGFFSQAGFFQAPHKQNLDGVDIAIVGSPLDLGAIGLAGGRHGPEAIRKGSHVMGPFHDHTGDIPFQLCNIIDYGDVQWSATDLQIRLEDIAQVFLKLGQAGCATLNCGGEHTTAYGALKGLSQGHDNEAFGLIHIDAHCDTMASWGGDAVNDGSVFRQAVLQGFIDPERTVQIGIRGRSNFLWDFSKESGMTIITADEVFEKGVPYVLDKAKEIVGQDKTYFSFDVDGLCSSEMMATTGPEPFGLTARQVRDIILGSYDLNIIGADMVEFNPVRDANGSYAHTAAGLYWELLNLLTHVRRRQNGQNNPTLWV